MEARLYELIRAYQEHRAQLTGARVPEFRTRLLAEYAAARPDRYPEYVLPDGRLPRAVDRAIASGEILPLHVGHRDDHLVLRPDRPAAT